MTDSPTPSNAKPQLAARGVHKTYRMGDADLHVLRGVDMSVRAGEWLAVLGASGSGKSTLLHLLGGLDRPEKGDVEFEGQPVFGKPWGELERYRSLRVGFVFQFYHLLPELSALENVLISAMVPSGVFGWGKVKKDARERATALLQRLGLGERFKHRPTRLSGGERQRVAIARALINRPAVLLADEPTGNPDAETGRQIIDVFRELHRGGQTIVMVTHDRTVAAAADRRLVLEAGRVKE
ncbi:MAG: ABC transporter ATP-binding protein [Planctomycetota bacterium]|nr:ABC transporter ATP-binding protein [Planctomycetota bacterium]